MCSFFFFFFQAKGETERKLGMSIVSKFIDRFLDNF